jgi:Arc/MetJ-type ribon-helix-helix transcriptional regulator
MESKPAEEDLITGLQSFAEQIDGVPTIRDMRESGPYSPYFYKDTFGTWHDALRAAGIQPTHGVDVEYDRDALLEDLRRVDSRIDRPPRRKDVDEHGEYPYEAYDEEFDSFIYALKEAGIEPEEKQYRFSSVETPEDKKGSANVEMLRNDGPTPISELPQGVSAEDRGNGVWKFEVDSGAAQPATAICYLHEDHAPELVIRRFFEENPHVVEYQDPHAIKMDIGKHHTSWKDIGQDIVDELVEEGTVSPPQFENLVVVHVPNDETLDYCFETSVSSPVDLAELPFSDSDYTGQHPVWGFSQEAREIWDSLSEHDGILFKTDTGTFTHYMPVSDTVKSSDVMTALWVEYDDGVRTGGIDHPLPLLVIGSQVQRVSLPEAEFADEIDTELSEESIQWIDEDVLEPLVSSYGSFESYLRNRDHSPDRDAAGVGLKTDGVPGDVDDESTPDLSETEPPTTDTKDNVYHISQPAMLAVHQAVSDPEGSEGTESDVIASTLRTRLKQVIDDPTPRVTETPESTVAVTVDVESHNQTLIDGLCGENGTYESPSAFVEDAIRTELDVPEVSETEVTIPPEVVARITAVTELGDNEGTVTEFVHEAVEEKLEEQMDEV